LPILLDTHAFLWWCEDSPQLSVNARKVIAEDNCFVSMVSFWEVAIKYSLGRLGLPTSIERYLPEQMSLNSFETLEIGFRQIAGTATLAWHHRDPFDRLLAAQAIEEKLMIVSRDPVFDAYGVKRIW
jgi:PIN domain nuclease of toxin-antitoxin system